MIPVYIGEIWIFLVVAVIILFLVRIVFIPSATIVKVLVIGLAWMVFNLIVEYIGVSLGFWAPENSLYLIAGAVSIELAPITLFSGAWWIIEFDRIKTVRYKLMWFLLTAVTGGYVTALLIHEFAWMEHYGWWNIGWTFLFYMGIFGTLILMGWIYDLLHDHLRGISPRVSVPPRLSL